MTCHDPDRLATLVLARHLLLARALELHDRFDAMAAVHSAPIDPIRPPDEDDSRTSQRFDDLDAEMRMVSPLLVYLEQRIRSASRRVL